MAVSRDARPRLWGGLVPLYRPSLLNSPELRLLCEEGPPEVGGGAESARSCGWSERYGAATRGRGILSTAPRERRGEDELGGKESRQLLLTASVAEQNKF